MQYFNFTRLIQKYMTEFTAFVSVKGGYDDSGEYIKSAPEEKTLTGAIVSVDEKTVYRSEGKLTIQDRRLYMLEPIDNALMGGIVRYKGNRYTIESCLENAEFTGVYSYTLKFNSAFSDKED